MQILERKFFHRANDVCLAGMCSKLHNTAIELTIRFD